MGGWPATLSADLVGVRPLRRRDAKAWCEARIRNETWLKEWEATPGLSKPSWSSTSTAAVFHSMRRRLKHDARHGRCLPFAITWDAILVGQLTIGNVVRGAFNSGYAGYWIDERYAGRDIVPTALALVTDHCFGSAGMHRIEVNIRPENLPSKRVVEKLGFREEALHTNYLAINGQYRDHIGYALTVEDVPGGLLKAFLSGRSS